MRECLRVLKLTRVYQTRHFHTFFSAVYDAKKSTLAGPRPRVTPNLTLALYFSFRIHLHNIFSSHRFIIYTLCRSRFISHRLDPHVITPSYIFVISPSHRTPTPLFPSAYYHTLLLHRKHSHLILSADILTYYCTLIVYCLIIFLPRSLAHHSSIVKIRTSFLHPIDSAFASPSHGFINSLSVAYIHSLFLFFHHHQLHHFSTAQM
jgi:hypothetical protein